MSVSEADNQRATQRRHLQQRQTVIFGSIVAVMVLTLLVSWLMLIGVLPSPFNRAFSVEEKPQLATEPVCPPDGGLTVPLTEITANVYNSTDVGGLAGTVSAALSTAGVVVNGTGNWEEPQEGIGFLLTGSTGLEEAYTLQLAFPGMIVLTDSREDALVDVVLGSAFTGAPDLSLIVPDQPLPVPAECQPEGQETAPPADNTDAPADS